MMKKDEKKQLNLTESEIRSVVKGELRRLTEAGSNPSFELSLVVSDALLDGVRDIAAQAARDPRIQSAFKQTGPVDPRQTAEKIVNTILTQDPDFRTDLVSLVAAMVKRAATKS
jgi:hypothetical protein